MDRRNNHRFLNSQRAMKSNLRNILHSCSLILIAFLTIPISSCTGNNSGELKLSITTNIEVIFGAEGGSSIITYTIDNGTNEMRAEASTSDSWISIDSYSEYGIIEYTVSKNISSSDRIGKIAVSLNEQTIEITLTQLGTEESDDQVDVRCNAKTFWGLYYGKKITSKAGNYWIILSEDEIDEVGNLSPDSKYYRLDIFAPFAEDLENIRIPDGEYSYDQKNSYSQYTFTAENSSFITTDSFGTHTFTSFQEAELTINGSQIVLNATINGEKHRVEFDGDYTIKDFSPKDYGSTLEGDIVADLSNHTAIVSSYGDYWNCGYCNWWIEIIPNNEDFTGASFIIDFLTDSLDATDNLTGVYPSCGFSEEDPTKPAFGPNTFVPGMVISMEGHMTGTLYLEYKEHKTIAQAPLEEGFFEVKDNGDGTHTIFIEMYDDAPEPHKVTASWSGVLLWD